MPDDDDQHITTRIEHARRTSRLLQNLGWFVATVGIVGMAVFIVLWLLDDLSTEQAVSLVLGTMLATVLSGAAAYGSGVNIGLGAERLALAVEADRRSTSPSESPSESPRSEH